MARLGVIVAFAFVGWAVCGATIGIGFGLLSEQGALILHAVVAPIAFAGLSWLYFSHFAYTTPLPTAALFVGVVLTLDIFVVALLIERSFAMFASVLGTWVPLFLIFGSTWATGSLVDREGQAG